MSGLTDANKNKRVLDGKVIELVDSCLNESRVCKADVRAEGGESLGLVPEDDRDENLGCTCEYSDYKAENE
jgi:hypothetical protein